MGIWDFLTADYQTRQARTRALNQGLLGFFNGITPGLGDRVSSANALINPIDQMGEAGANTVVAFDPSYSPDVRRRAALNAGIGTITAAAPAIGGAAIGAPARRGIMETLANVTGPMDDAATRFLADEAGSVPLGRVDPAAKRGEEVLGLLSSGRASEVTDEMLDMGDPVLNARLNEYLFNNYDLPMDEASRLARAREMGFEDDAYHATGADFQQFVPSEFRGASFFGATPDGAVKGASASANEGVGSGATSIIPVSVNTRGVEGLGAYSRRDMNDFRSSLPDRTYTEAEVDALMSSSAAPLRGDWSYYFDDLTDYDALRVFRDENPTAPIPEGVISYRPKQPLRYDADLRTDLSGRQFAHYSEGMSERPTSDYVRSQGNTGFTMLDESGLALAMTDPAQVRSRFARFDPRLAHLRNLSAGLGGMGLLGYIGAQQDEPRF